MTSGGLLIAEQCIDRQVRPYLFRGRQLESVTGRVLLHAIDGAGRALCGLGREHLTPTGQPWQARYLPHLPRCRGCARPGEATVSGQPGQDSDLPAPASGADIRTAHGTAAENDGRAALHEVLAEHDLRCWMFTDLVMIDETIRGGVSHPLTLSPASLMRSPVRALSMFLHELLASPDWFSAFLRRHGLQVPRQPPVPRSYFGEQ